MNPVGITITTAWWDEEKGCDVPANKVFVTIWAPHSNSSCQMFEHTCDTPRELWDYLHRLSEDKQKVLREEFNYQPPTGEVKLPANLLELFK